MSAPLAAVAARRPHVRRYGNLVARVDGDPMSIHRGSRTLVVEDCRHAVYSGSSRAHGPDPGHVRARVRATDAVPAVVAAVASLRERVASVVVGWRWMVRG